MNSTIILDRSRSEKILYKRRIHSQENSPRCSINTWNSIENTKIRELGRAGITKDTLLPCRFASDLLEKRSSISLLMFDDEHVDQRADLVSFKLHCAPNKLSLAC